MILICNIYFSNKFKGKVLERLFNESPKKDEPLSSDKNLSKTPLKTFKFFIHKTHEKNSDKIKKLISELGGEITKKFEKDLTAVISTSSTNFFTVKGIFFWVYFIKKKGYFCFR